MPLRACHPRHASPTSCHVPCALECFDRTSVHITARLLDSRANNCATNHFHFAAHHVAERAAIFTANRADRAQLIRAAVTGIMRDNFANRTPPTPINRGAGATLLLFFLPPHSPSSVLSPPPRRALRHRATPDHASRRRPEFFAPPPSQAFRRHVLRSSPRAAAVPPVSCSPVASPAASIYLFHSSSVGFL